MREWKPALPWKGEPLILHALRPALKATGQVVLVGGYHFDVLRRLVQSTAAITDAERGRISVVENGGYSTGMFSSVQAGISNVRGKVDGLFILPGDMPSVRAATFSELIAAFEARQEIDVFTPALATSSGKRSTESRTKKGHPVLVRSRIVPELLAADARSILRDVLRRFSASIVEVDDPGIALDIDVESDFSRLGQMEGEWMKGG